MGCNDKLNVKGIWCIAPKYNYRKKVFRALEDGNIKYLEMLIKKGKLKYISYDSE